MAAGLGFEPAYTTAQTVAEHAKAAGIKPLVPPELVRDTEQRLIGLLDGYAKRVRDRAERSESRG